MDRAAELDFALDVDHLALAQPGGGGDARGLAEGEVAQIDHGQAVDLADLRAGGVDQQCRAGLPPALVAQAAGAVALRVDRALRHRARRCVAPPAWRAQ